MFQFSVEELYLMYGQFDKYIEIYLHKYSESAKKFGKHIGGVLLYTRAEREELEKTTKDQEIPRTNHFVKIQVTSNYDLSEGQLDELKNKGFLSGDINVILASAVPTAKSYLQQGVKEIPNTITINVDGGGIDFYRMNLGSLSRRIENEKKTN